MGNERSTTPTGLVLSCHGKRDYLVVSDKATVVVKDGNPNIGNDTQEEAGDLEN